IPPRSYETPPVTLGLLSELQAQIFPTAGNMAGRDARENGGPRRPSNTIHLESLESGEEDEHGYVHPARLDGAEVRRPSVPYHTRNLIRQLPSRNLGKCYALLHNCCVMQ
ncbi:hypothetical protein MTO96_036322, partial [Rhipicephalus appendiculatus]